MQTLIETFFARKEEYLQALIEHMQLSFISLLFAALIAIPLAIYLTSHRKLAESLLQVTGIFQTIPSLALLGCASDLCLIPNFTKHLYWFDGN